MSGERGRSHEMKKRYGWGAASPRFWLKSRRREQRLFRDYRGVPRRVMHWTAWRTEDATNDVEQARRWIEGPASFGMMERACFIHSKIITREQFKANYPPPENDD